jgi:hypothetical protein
MKIILMVGGGVACVSTLYLVLLLVGLIGMLSPFIMVFLICVLSWVGMNLGARMYNSLKDAEDTQYNNEK